MNASAPAAAPILECLGIVAAPCGITVHVKAPGQMFGLSLERALFRIDEFTELSQDIVLGAIPLIYSIPGCRPMFLTPLERRLIKNMRSLDKVYARTMWEVIDDLAEEGSGTTAAVAAHPSTGGSHQ